MPLIRIRYTHEAMIDKIIANPWVSNIELAEYFGYSQSWVSTIITSGAFQAKLAERKEELVDPLIRLNLEDRFKALTSRSLEVLQAKLCRSIDDIPDMLVLKAVELGTKALGLGMSDAPQVVIASEDRLEKLAHRLIALQGRGTGPVIDVAARELA